jgi:hypothetical protein
MAAVTAAMPAQAFALAISTGSQVNIGTVANAVVQVSDATGQGTGTILKIQTLPDGDEDLLVLTADHVVRDNSGNLDSPGDVSIMFGNTGGGGASFTASALASDFTIPEDGSSAVDLAMLDVDVPQDDIATLPSPLTAVGLPSAQPTAGTNITQVGYGLQASVVSVGGTLSYSYSGVYSDGGPYGTLLAGPNSLNSTGVTTVTGATSTYGSVKYVYAGFRNDAVINGTANATASGSYVGSTSYIFSGDSGGPSLSTDGLTLLGVHSSSITGQVAGDTASSLVLGSNTSYYWTDVSTYDNLTWINDELTNLSPVPEPAVGGLFVAAMVGFLASARTRSRRRPAPAAIEPRGRLDLSPTS